MNHFEESHHLRSIFRQMGENVAEKMEVVARIRNVALRLGAVDLLRLCDYAIEDGELPVEVQERILTAYAMLDSAAVTSDKLHRIAQSKKAAQPRGKGDDGRTLGDLIKSLAANHSQLKPSEIWPHLKSAIEAWAGPCVEKKIDGRTFYQYCLSEKQRTITYGQFCVRLREFKNKNSV